MSTRKGNAVEFKCFNDCVQTGCPGHSVRMIYYNTSDTFGVEVDSQRWYVFDPEMFRTMIKAYQKDCEQY
jgi:hypothetical protein